MDHKLFIELRESLTLSRNEMAHFLGVSEASIIRWEKGKSQPQGLHYALYDAISKAIIKQPKQWLKDAITHSYIDPLFAVLRVIQMSRGI